MSRKFNWRNSLIYFLIVFLVLTYLVHFNGCYTYKARPGIVDYEAKEEDSLTMRYNAIKDSMNRIETNKQFQLSYRGDLIAIGGFGVSSMKSPIAFLEDNPSPAKHYFVLPYYTLNPDATYSVEGDKFLLQSLVWDKTTKPWRGHYVTNQIPIRFAENAPNKNELQSFKKGSVLIPITTAGYKVFKVAMLSLYFILAALFVFYVIVLPTKVLRRISKADFFHYKNIPDLRATSFFLFGFWAFTSLFPLAFYCIFSGIIPRDITISYWDVLLGNKGFLLIGLIVLLIANAFKRGYEMEKELAAPRAFKK